MMKPKFQSCWVSRSLTTDSTRSSPTSSPAAMVRRTWAPILVWFCTFHRKISPTPMWTRSRSAASIWLCVPLPLPCTPMITYLRMSSAWHMHRGVAREAEPPLTGPPHPAADQQPELRPVFAQPLGVEEPGHVVPAALADHDAVQQQPGLLPGHVELAELVPAQVHRQHDSALPRPVQIIEAVRQPPGRGGQAGTQTHAGIIHGRRYPGGMENASCRGRVE